MTLTLKPGYYKTRDGQKAYVAAECPFDTQYPIVGWVLESDGEAHQACWTKVGQYNADGTNCSDLVSEWHEPVRGEAWANVYPSGNTRLFKLRRNAELFCDAGARTIRIRYEEIPEPVEIADAAD